MQICQKAYEMLRSYHGAFLLESFNSEGLYWFRKNAPEVLRGQLSSRLTKEKSDVSWFLRVFVENLLCIFLGRPDFIAYKLTDLPKLTVTLLRIFSGTTIAVWTLRTKDAIHEGKQEYDIQIFENPVKILGIVIPDLLHDRQNGIVGGFHQGAGIFHTLHMNIIAYADAETVFELRLQIRRAEQSDFCQIT